MPKPILLIPPSEGKAPGGDGPPWSDGARAFPALDPPRREVISALRRAMRGDLADSARLLGVGSGAASDAVSRNLVIDSAPTLPAIHRYQGVLYDALGYDSLSEAHRRRVDEQVLIFSGLWGVVAPRDPIPDYKLKMGASLPPLGRLSTWWRPRLSPLVDEVVAGRVVWNLLPAEHAAAWRPAGTAKLTVRVRFLDEVKRGGSWQRITVSHWNKLLKGALIRHVIARQLIDPDDLTRFTHPEGYEYRPDLTVERDGEVEVSLVARRD